MNMAMERSGEVFDFKRHMATDDTEIRRENPPKKGFSSGFFRCWALICFLWYVCSLAKMGNLSFKV
jgi:hypothetical protein